jgi:hypothetical protein
MEPSGHLTPGIEMSSHAKVRKGVITATPYGAIVSHVQPGDDVAYQVRIRRRVPGTPLATGPGSTSSGTSDDGRPLLYTLLT